MVTPILPCSLRARVTVLSPLVVWVLVPVSVLVVSVVVFCVSLNTPLTLYRELSVVSKSGVFTLLLVSFVSSSNLLVLKPVTPCTLVVLVVLVPVLVVSFPLSPCSVLFALSVKSRTDDILPVLLFVPCYGVCYLLPGFCLGICTRPLFPIWVVFIPHSNNTTPAIHSCVLRFHYRLNVSLGQRLERKNSSFRALPQNVIF